MGFSYFLIIFGQTYRVRQLIEVNNANVVIWAINSGVSIGLPSVDTTIKVLVHFNITPC